jgi:eukaryotic-like serine/threonine-protein kinase
MALTLGTKLGPYEILSAVGAGGMGEVYRARDTRLDRTVAVKILPAAVSSDADRMARFQHEARILSTLNHPNVLAIFDVGEQNGVRYLVSEFLEGQSLRELLAASSLPRRAVAEYALEIAKGLAAAHEKGVVHRDLKPDNIFVTRDDRVKILDFGLAKQAPATHAAEESPTMTMPAPTTPGTVMGTVGYMSPEQVRGQALDHRSDIFSFGAVLYEMAAGKRAFSGESSVETMNAILKEDVQELSASGAHVAPGLEKIIRRCLEKKPERRFQSASDLAFAIEALSATSGISQALPTPAAAVPLKSRLPWILAAVSTLALIVLGFWFYKRPAAGPVSFTQISFRPSYIRMARFAPGGLVVYAASIDGAPMTLFSTRTDTFQSQPLNIKADLLSISRSGELAVSLDRVFDFWTPHGRLAKVPLGGGATRELLDGVIDADWNEDESELAISRRVPSGSRLEYPPGKVLYETAGYVSDVRFSPAGDQIAFFDHPEIGDDRGWVSVIDLQGHRRVLTQEFAGEQGLAWSPAGNEIWFSAYASPSEPMPIRAVDLHGKVRLVASAPTRMHLQDIAADGKVLLTTDVESVDAGVGEAKSGRLRRLYGIERLDVLGISNDGGMLLMNGFDTGNDSNYQLYIQRTDGSAPVLIGEGNGTGFSSDGKWAAAVDVPHPENLLIIPTSVGNSSRLKAPPGHIYIGAGFLPDGKRLLITMQTSGQVPQSAVQDLESGAIRPVGPSGRYVHTIADVLFPGPSPDGKFCIQTDGQNHYWLQAIDGDEAREIKGIDSSEQIVAWHSDSNNVFVMHPQGLDTEIYTLNLTTGERKLWVHFSPPDKTAIRGTTFVHVTPDGASFAYTVRKMHSTLFVAAGLH